MLVLPLASQIAMHSNLVTEVTITSDSAKSNRMSLPVVAIAANVNLSASFQKGNSIGKSF